MQAHTCTHIHTHTHTCTHTHTHTLSLSLRAENTSPSFFFCLVFIWLWVESELGTRSPDLNPLAANRIVSMTRKNSGWAVWTKWGWTWGLESGRPGSCEIYGSLSKSLDSLIFCFLICKLELKRNINPSQRVVMIGLPEPHLSHLWFVFQLAWWASLLLPSSPCHGFSSTSRQSPNSQHATPDIQPHSFHKHLLSTMYQGLF